jgi:hypothetical protein
VFSIKPRTLHCRNEELAPICIPSCICHTTDTF